MSQDTIKILVCGSRDWNDRATMREALSYMPVGTVIVHGAARGADSMAEETAHEFDFGPPIAYPANWKQHGKAAGPIRNRNMLADNPGLHLVMAFVPRSFGDDWQASSRGTAHMVRAAMENRIPVVVVRSRS